METIKLKIKKILLSIRMNENKRTLLSCLCTAHTVFFLKNATSGFGAFASSCSALLREMWLVSWGLISSNAGSDYWNLKSFLPPKTKVIRTSLGEKHSWLCLYTADGSGGRSCVHYWVSDIFVNSVETTWTSLYIQSQHSGLFLSSKWTPDKRIMSDCWMNMDRKEAGLCSLSSCRLLDSSTLRRKYISESYSARACTVDIA